MERNQRGGAVFRSRTRCLIVVFCILQTRLIHIPTYGRGVMTSWPDLEPMPNSLVNYGVTDNGIAIIELASNSAGAPLEGDEVGPNTYTHEMMRDIDTAVVKARFNDDVSVILITGHGHKFFSAGASIQMLNSVTPGFKYNFCLHANETLSDLNKLKLVSAQLTVTPLVED